MIQLIFLLIFGGTFLWFLLSGESWTLNLVFWFAFGVLNFTLSFLEEKFKDWKGTKSWLAWNLIQDFLMFLVWTTLLPSPWGVIVGGLFGGISVFRNVEISMRRIES